MIETESEMARTVRNDADTIIIPGGNSIALGPDLANQFEELQRDRARSVVQMAVLAHAVREANKNQSGEPTKEFRNWYKNFNMEKVFGSRSNFSKHASAGAVILKHKAVLARDLTQLPLRIQALYEIHDLTDEELSLCLENTFTRDSNTVTDKNQFKSPKKPKPVINPNATSKSIRTWKENWRNPPVPKTDKRTISFITITADASIYDFNKNTAAPTGKTTLEQLRRIEVAVANALAGQDSHVRMKSEIDAISDGIARRRKKVEDALSKKKIAPKRRSTKS